MKALNGKYRLTARQVDERRCCMKVPSLTPAASRLAGGRCNAPRKLRIIGQASLGTFFKYSQNGQ
jgi:hypothetical protein